MVGQSKPDLELTRLLKRIAVSSPKVKCDRNFLNA